MENFIALHPSLYCLGTGSSQFSQEDRHRIYQWMMEDERSYLEKYVSASGREKARLILIEAAKKGIRILTPFDEGYPVGAVDGRPPVLYLKGQLPNPAEHPYIAIVGSRKATSYGQEMTKKIVRELAPYDVTIISGLAYGIDAAAHCAALDAGLPTVAILGCGINYSYPWGHQGLAKQIASLGAVISEFPWGAPPLQHHFPLRNRLISGLSLGVIVVEAMAKSGSLITAHWAFEQGREVFAVPGMVGRVMNSGTNLLIKEGAHLIESGEDVAAVLNLKKCETDPPEAGPRQPTYHSSEGGLAPSAEKKSGQEFNENVKQAVLDFLKSGGRNIEVLASLTGLSPSELLPMVTEIELGFRK